LTDECQDERGPDVNALANVSVVLDGTDSYGPDAPKAYEMSNDISLS
jgi:hypothetical protein